MTRQIPSDCLINEDIWLHIRGGARVPELEVDGQDNILITLNGLINGLLEALSERRPTASGTNSKLANFIRTLVNNAYTYSSLECFRSGTVLHVLMYTHVKSTPAACIVQRTVFFNYNIRVE